MQLIASGIAIQLGEGPESPRVPYPLPIAFPVLPTTDSSLDYRAGLQPTGALSPTLPLRPAAEPAPAPTLRSTVLDDDDYMARAPPPDRATRMHTQNAAVPQAPQPCAAPPPQATPGQQTMTTIFQAPLTSTGAIHILDDSLPQEPPIPVDDDDINAEILRPAPSPTAPRRHTQPPLEVDLAADDDHMPAEEAPKTPSCRSPPYGREPPTKQARPAPVPISQSSGLAPAQQPLPYPIVLPPASLCPHHQGRRRQHRQRQCRQPRHPRGTGSR